MKRGVRLGRTPREFVKVFFFQGAAPTQGQLPPWNPRDLTVDRAGASQPPLTSAHISHPSIRVTDFIWQNFLPPNSMEAHVEAGRSGNGLEYLIRCD